MPAANQELFANRTPRPPGDGFIPLKAQQIVCLDCGKGEPNPGTSTSRTDDLHSNWSPFVAERRCGMGKERGLCWLRCPEDEKQGCGYDMRRDEITHLIPPACFKGDFLAYKICLSDVKNATLSGLALWSGVKFNQTSSYMGVILIRKRKLMESSLQPSLLQSAAFYSFSTWWFNIPPWAWFLHP